MKLWPWLGVLYIAISAFTFFFLPNQKGHWLHTFNLWLPVFGTLVAITGRAFIKHDWAKTSAKGKQEFRRHFIAVMLIVATTVLLAILGFWDIDSPRYWRRPAQTAIFFATHYLPKSVVARTTNLALLTHPAGTTYSEIEEAALLYERVGETNRSSPLWLSLVQQDIEMGKDSQAIKHATLSQKANSNLKALVALVVLTNNSSTAKDQWVSEIQAKHPEHELSRVFQCIKQLESFGNAIPAPCTAVDWVHQRARNGKDEYLKIVQQIKDLPREAAQNIKQKEGEIANLANEQMLNRSEYASVTAKINHLNDWGWLEAGVQAGVDMLPLPKAGDTPGTWAFREGFCALPVARFVCRASDIAKAASDLEQRKQEAAKSRDNLAELIGLNNRLIEFYKADIKHWRSGEPLEELVSARNNLIPSFRSDVDANVSARRQQIGVSSLEAIDIATQQD